MNTEFDNTHTYEQYTVNDKFLIGSYTMEKDEIMAFARRWDPMPFHVDEAAAAATQHGGIIACGSHLMAIRIHIIQRDGTNPHVVASGGYGEVRFHMPARPGDVMTLYGECLEKRVSKSKPDRGVVTLGFTMENQNGDTVLSMTDTIIVMKGTR